MLHALVSEADVVAEQGMLDSRGKLGVNVNGGTKASNLWIYSLCTLSLSLSLPLSLSHTHHPIIQTCVK